MPQLSGSVQLEYSKERFLYRDIYFGGRRFVGQETVYFDGTPVWAMSYAGGMIGSTADAGDVYAFLRRALLAVSQEEPFRGPKEVESQNLRYENTYQGDLGWFSGQETVCAHGVQVYALRYAGGHIVP
nr:DUF5680 domain-containing protein [Sulfobacillus harzensis]